MKTNSNTTSPIVNKLTIYKVIIPTGQIIKLEGSLTFKHAITSNDRGYVTSINVCIDPTTGVPYYAFTSGGSGTVATLHKSIKLSVLKFIDSNGNTIEVSNTGKLKK
jgi:hypothetical protein